jgi:hypothetical protein
MASAVRQLSWLLNEKALFPAGVVLACALASGCVSKARADAQAKAAFLAGQQEAMLQLQTRVPAVTVVGEVKNNVVPWTAELTLAKALVAAEYYGASDPTEIRIIRAGHEITVDPGKLLAGEDVMLQPRDIVDIKR